MIGCNRVKIIPNPRKKGFGPEYIKAIEKNRYVIGCWLIDNGPESLEKKGIRAQIPFIER